MVTGVFCPMSVRPVHRPATLLLVSSGRVASIGLRLHPAARCSVSVGLGGLCGLCVACCWPQEGHSTYRLQYAHVPHTWNWDRGPDLHSAVQQAAIVTARALSCLPRRHWAVLIAVYLLVDAINWAMERRVKMVTSGR